MMAESMWDAAKENGYEDVPAHGFAGLEPGQVLVPVARGAWQIVDARDKATVEALRLAREALLDVDDFNIGICPWCKAPGRPDGTDDAPDCLRQRALAAISAVLGEQEA